MPGTRSLSKTEIPPPVHSIYVADTSGSDYGMPKLLDARSTLLKLVGTSQYLRIRYARSTGYTYSTSEYYRGVPKLLGKPQYVLYPHSSGTPSPKHLTPVHTCPKH